MRAIVIALVAATALAVAGGAAGGGWATVGVSPLPDGTAAGSKWEPTLTILQHGRTPLDGVEPTVTIRSSETGETKTFSAQPTGEPGRYRADVAFPSAGRWRFEIDDGFSRTHTFAPVEIAPRAPAALSLPWTVAGSAVLILALAALVVAGMRRTAPRAAPTTG